MTQKCLSHWPFIRPLFTVIDRFWPPAGAQQNTPSSSNIYGLFFIKEKQTFEIEGVVRNWIKASSRHSVHSWRGANEDEVSWM
jgi:hypothetical protein